MAVSESSNRARWLVIVALTMLGLTLFFVPALIIRPFQHQSEIGLTLAIFGKQIAPLFTLVAAAGVLFLGVNLWSGARWGARAALMLAMVLSVGSAVMVRVNYFEWMFRPITAPGFTAAGDAQLGDSEMVMTVRMGQEARAYPIRQMAYHHVLNDAVGDVPIAVTY